MSNNPGRRARRAQRHGHRQSTRMSEYQRNRQAEAPRGEVKVHAHLHGLDINDAVELDEAGAFEGIPCATPGCGQAIEWSNDLDDWQHHATKTIRCRTAGRGGATPPDWYTGDPVVNDVPDEEQQREQLGEKITRVAAEKRAERTAKPPRVDGNPYDTEFAHGVLLGLQAKPVYQKGAVHDDEVQRRRLRNRDANRARRANRRSRVKRFSAKRGREAS